MVDRKENYKFDLGVKGLSARKPKLPLTMEHARRVFFFFFLIFYLGKRVGRSG